jgi:nucleotide-binding universal stress UspA family protein
MTIAPPTRIVVGVDGSPGSAEALRWAAEEAELHGATLTAVMAWGLLDQHPLDGVAFDPHFNETSARARLREHLVATVPQQGARVTPTLRSFGCSPQFVHVMAPVSRRAVIRSSS